MVDVTNKAVAHYFPDTNSMMMVLDDNHGATVSEEVAYDVIAIYNEADNRLVAIEIISGAREMFADLLAKAGKHAEAKAVKVS